MTHDAANEERPEPDAPPMSEHRRGLLDPLLDSSGEGLLGGLAETDAPRQATHDAWAHRRGEPRMFALMLSLYLLVSAMLTIFMAPVMGNPSAATFLNAARTLMVLVALGVVAIWPMTRLSQATPRRPALAGFVDAVVVWLLAQAVIWPTTILPGGARIWPAPWPGLWPWGVAAGIATLFASWALFIGAVIACGVARPIGWARAGWMIVALAGSTGAPAVALALGRFGMATPDALLLYSPVTAPLMFIEAPSGLTARMSSAEWLAAILPAVASVPFWLIVCARRRENA